MSATLNHEERQQIIRRLVERYEPSQLRREGTLRHLIGRELASAARTKRLTLKEQTALTEQLLHAMTGLDILQVYMDDPEVTEIMVNRYDDIYIERRGLPEPSPLVFDSSRHLTHVITRFFGRANKVLNERHPIGDMRLADGSRVHAILPPIAPDGPVLSIRRFTGILPRMDHLVANHTLSEIAADFLRRAVRARKNIFISGGTASGKTTLLNALAAFIPERERIITIEDAAELALTGHHNLVRLEARRKTAEGVSDVSLTDLIRSSLRLRPDRIIVGEVRGHEAYDMLQAMQTGHPGSMSTGHGNSAHDMLERLALLLMTASELPWEASRRMVASAVDLVVHLERTADGQRRVKEILKLTGYEKGQFRLSPALLSPDNA